MVAALMLYVEVVFCHAISMPFTLWLLLANSKLIMPFGVAGVFKVDPVLPITTSITMVPIASITNLFYSTISV
jgi:hypothetical protein